MAASAGNKPFLDNGAGGGSRTRVSALGRLHNGRYTTPATHDRTNLRFFLSLRFAFPFSCINKAEMNSSSLIFFKLNRKEIRIYFVFPFTSQEKEQRSDEKKRSFVSYTTWSHLAGSNC